MALILLALSGFMVIAGVRLTTFSGTPLHVYQAFVLFLIACILFVGAAVIESINALRRQLEARD